MSAPSLLFAAALLQEAPPRALEPQERTLRLAVLETLEVELPLSDQRVDDVDGGGRDALLLVARDGRLRLHGQAAVDGRSLLAPLGELRLEDPAHALLDLARLDADGRAAQLVAATPKGVLAWSIGPDGGFAAEPHELAPRARFTFRTGTPRLAQIAQDVNQDGRADLVLPVLDACELWLNQGAPAGGEGAGAAEAGPWPELRRTARVPVEVDRWTREEAEELSDVLVGSFSIPDLRTRDVNGDARPDLLVEDGSRRSFFLQAENGTFPSAATVEVDLSIFRDTTAAGGIAPGRTLALDGEATFESRDLDGDAVPDYVIAHRRKVWVFLGTQAGPQFTQPLSILKTAEDTTALTLALLDGDALPDLVLFKVQVPTIATLLRGLFGQWDVEIGAFGYKNQGGAGFEPSPSFRSELVVRLPSIVGILKNPGELLERFEDLRSRFRTVVRGDLDGDGRPDLALVDAEGRRLEAWLSPSGDDGMVDADRALREVFFEATDKVWDIDRILLWLGGLAERQVALRTGGRPPSAAIALRSEERLRLSAVEAADLDGDGRDELLVGYRPPDGVGNSLFDVLRLAD